MSECKHGLPVKFGCPQCEIESLRAEHGAQESLISDLRSQLADANNHHVEMQRHRDAWRKYAYGRGERPQDFLDGNMVPSERGLTRIEELERILDDTIGIDNISFTTEQIDAAWNRIQNLKLEWNRNSWVSSLQQATYLVQALAFFGIVACEECGGSGKKESRSSSMREEPMLWTCPTCDGHGWRIK